MGQERLDDNRLIVSGRLVELDALRYTPGGVPILKFRLMHESTQTEAGGPRKVGCELSGVAFETEARLLASAPLGAAMRITGFLDRKGRSGRQIVLHATHIEYLPTDT